jgi:hypothetical protein
LTDTTDLLRELKAAVQRGEPLDNRTRDMLLFTALISLFEQLETLQPVLTFYKIALWVSSAFGILTVGIIFGIVTGQWTLAKP